MFKFLIACLSIHLASSLFGYNEKNNPNKSLTFLYQTKGGSLLRKLITSNKWFSSLAGFYCDLAISKYHIPRFVNKHGISMEESEKKDFTSFNDFFIRTLKPSARPIDPTPSSISSAADGKIVVLENIDTTVQFPIKNISFSLESFLKDRNLAQEYMGGTLIIIRLDPWDYHRFHIPINGCVHKACHINGKYDSVNPVVYEQNIQVLAENERHLLVIHSTECGKVLMIPVGALCVGKIVETYNPEQFYTKGNELGYFAFGGSTIVLVFKKDTISINDEIISNSLVYQETPIKMGQSIGNIKTIN